DYIALKNHFDLFLKKYNIEVVSSDTANHKEIFKRYFEKLPPFGIGQKKDQFPDAFILNTIELWCENNMSGVFVVSSDKDMLSYTSNRFDVLDGIGQMLNIFVNASELYKSVYGLLVSKMDFALKDLKNSINNYIDEFSVLLYERLLA